MWQITNKIGRIKWKIFKYYNYVKFLGTLHNIINGIIDNFFDIAFNKIDFFHIRSHIPGITIIPLMPIFNIKFIFDMRGFWVDEKVDRLGWNKKGI